MKFKLDENLGRRCIELLAAEGHDVATVAGQKKTSAEDGELIEACRVEGRALITLDRDFAPVRGAKRGCACGECKHRHRKHPVSIRFHS